MSSKKFYVRYTRQVTITEFVEREILAPDLVTAEREAETDAAEFNQSCPDDARECGSGGFEASDWEVAEIELVPEPFRCKGCGRPEPDCSAEPCGDVIADRGEL